MSILTKKCKNCGVEFFSLMPTKEFCSNKCRNTYRGREKSRRKKERLLKNGGYEVYRQRINERHKRYYKAPPPRNCPVCGNILEGVKRYCEKCRPSRNKKYAKKYKYVYREPKQRYCSCGNPLEKRKLYCSNCLDVINKERAVIKKLARKSKERFLKSDLTANEWKQTLQYFGGRCAYCGEDKEIHEEHFIPVKLGGGFTKDNIIPACRRCNLDKGSKHPEEWLSDRKYLYNELKSYLETRSSTN